MIFSHDGLDRRTESAGPAARQKERKGPETVCTQLETRVDFFYFFARNPLKSPDSDEQNQGNPSIFAWIYLVSIGRNARPGCIRDVGGSFRRAGQAWPRLAARALRPVEAFARTRLGQRLADFEP